MGLFRALPPEGSDVCQEPALGGLLIAGQELWRDETGLCVTDTYRLVFRGEVIEGQHPAVVRKRLAMALKLDDERVLSMFTGEPVVVRKAADATTAARFQAVFKKAGARLRVFPVASEAVPDMPGTTSGPTPADTLSTEALADQTGAGSAEWVILPVGSDLLEPEERQPVVPLKVDTSHLALVKMVAFAAAEVERERQEIEAPHFDVLPAGARIGEPRDVPEVLVDANFELAAVGARMGPDSALQAAPVILATEFELAAPGARMAPEQTGQNIPRPPDVTHLSVIENTRPLSPP